MSRKKEPLIEFYTRMVRRYHLDLFNHFGIHTHHVVILP